MDADAQNFLRRQKWDDLYKEMVRYTAFISRVGPSTSVKSGVSPEDIAATVMRKVWEGKRKWDPKKCPDFLHFLKWACQGELSNLRTKKKDLPLEQIPTETDADGVETEKDFGKVEGDPVIEVLDGFTAKDIEQLVVESFDGDKVLEEVYLSLQDGVAPREVSKKLGLTEKQIYNARKVVVRRLREITEPLKKSSGEKSND